MQFIQNFPFFCIIASMFAGIVTLVLPGRLAKWLHLVVVGGIFALSVSIMVFTLKAGESYTYMMGHFPAPWGNEIKIGPLEGFFASVFSLVMFLSFLGGADHITKDIKPSKQNLFFILMDLMMASLLALVYTNDMFTAYVFIEINTLSACGLILVTNNDRSYISALRYMMMSLVGSGLFLLGLSMLYNITGHLLMEPLHETILALQESGNYGIALTTTMILMSVGLCIKSGLVPFHTWIPDAYSYTTPTSSAVLSSLVSKSYIVLLIKIFTRVLDYESVVSGRLFDIFFVFGVVAMIVGSIQAIQESNIKRMTAFSSVAQIGYIYMGLGLGTFAGVVAAIFHIVSHGIMKSAMFLSIPGIIEASEGSLFITRLRRAGYKNPVSGAVFTIGALSMVGIPLLTGFISKYLFATSAATAGDLKMLIAWAALVISTVLNAMYFLRVVLTLYYIDDDVEEETNEPTPHIAKIEAAGLIALAVLMFALGVASGPIINIIETGLGLF